MTLYKDCYALISCILVNYTFISYPSVLIQKLGTDPKEHANTEFNICMKSGVDMEFKKEIRIGECHLGMWDCLTLVWGRAGGGSVKVGSEYIVLPIVLIKFDWFALGLISENETQTENKLRRYGRCQVSETESAWSVHYEVGQNHRLRAVISASFL
jgi:hypothetical protein